MDVIHMKSVALFCLYVEIDSKKLQMLYKNVCVDMGHKGND